MEPPTPEEEKTFSFKDNRGSTIEVKMNLKESNIMFRSELSDNQISKRRFSSKSIQ